MPRGWVRGQAAGTRPGSLSPPTTPTPGTRAHNAMGAAGEAPCVCTGHPGMWRDGPWGPLSQELQALGQKGEGPPSAGGAGPVRGQAQGKWGAQVESGFGP